MASFPTLHNQPGLSKLKDTKILYPIDSDVVIFDDAQNIWTNKPASAIPTDLENLQDVNIAIVQDGQVLKYDANTQLWANANLQLADMDDVAFGTLTTNDILQYNGTSWINAPLSGLNMNLADLNDVTIGGVQDRDFLAYDSGTSQWINRAIEFNTDMSDVLITGIQVGDKLKWTGVGGWENTADTLNSLNDVTLTGDTTGHILIKSGSVWVNQMLNLDLLNDVNAPTPITGDVLYYNGTNWINTPLALDALTDVTITSLATNDILQYNGTAWVNVPMTSISLALDDLSDVTITSVTGGDILGYSGAEWVNIALTLNLLNDVSITSVQTGETIRWSGTEWINDRLFIDDLEDVIITSAATDQILMYNGSDWVNTTATLDKFLTLIPSPGTLTFPSQSTGEISYQQHNVMGDGDLEWEARIFAYGNIAPGQSRKQANSVVTPTQLPELQITINPALTGYHGIKGVIYVTSDTANRTVVIQLRRGTSTIVLQTAFLISGTSTTVGTEYNTKDYTGTGNGTTGSTLYFAVNIDHIEQLTAATEYTYYLYVCSGENRNGNHTICEKSHLQIENVYGGVTA